MNALREQNVQVAAGALGAEPAPKGQRFQMSVRAAGRLFAVHYPEEPLAAEAPARRVPYLEAGCL